MLTLDKFEEASEKVKEVTLETKLIYSDFLSDQTGNKVYLKPENMQFTGAYKVRGAYYKISTLTDEERAKGLITASAGNHAQGVAYAAKCYGCKAVIVMPTTTPLIKVNRTKSYGAEVVLYGDVYDEACAKAYELAEKEDRPLSKVIYKTMQRNQVLAKELNRPSCQDTGVLQFWVKCGTNFPLIGELEGLLKEAVVKATFEAPLRHNSVETFDEYNTGKNVGKGTPTVFWDIVPDSDKCEIYTYMAGGGCTLPGKAMVLMPGEGYEGVTKFVMDVMTSYGLNACPPLLVGVGVATSVETAALLSKKALMRPLGSHNENERAASMEKLLEDGINAIGLGPQGMGGKYSVMGVHIENTARHPSTIGVAVNVGCWSHRRGHIIFDKDLNYTITTHSGVTL